MFIPTLQTLPLSIFFKHSCYNLKQVLGDNITTFRYGRDALWWGLKLLKIKKGENVLMPCSLCDVVLHPFLSLGINIKYYRLDKRLNYDINDIDSKIDSSTRAIYLIHYFGFPQDINPIKNLCNKKSLFLIEDCAHSLLGSYRGKLLGDYGDISIFSLRKFLPIPDGGCLKVNPLIDKLPDTELRNTLIKPTVNLIKLLLKDLDMKGVIPLKYIKTIWNNLKLPARELNLDLNNIDIYSAEFNYNISCYSKYIISKLNVDKIVSARKTNYNFWLDNIESLPDFTPLFPHLPEEINPYSFPVLVRNRDALLRQFEREGLFFEPTLNRPFYNLDCLLNKKESFPEIEYLAERFLSLPVHQSINLKLLEKIRSKISKFL